MTIAFTPDDMDSGTEIRAGHDGLLQGASLADNEVGRRVALAKLAAPVEGKLDRRDLDC